MENYELFEKLEKSIESLGLKLTKVGEVNNRYVYLSKKAYEDVETFWCIEVNKNGISNYHMLEVEILSIPISIDRVEKFLLFFNRFNGSFFDVTFYLRYDEEEDRYKIVLRRCYLTDDKDFNGFTYASLIFSTNQLLRDVIPQLKSLKYNESLFREEK